MNSPTAIAPASGSVLARHSVRHDRLRADPEPRGESTVIRVVVTDAEPQVRSLHTAALSAVSDVSVVCEAATVHEAMTAVERHRPDVLVMDFSLPDLDGCAASASVSAAGKVTRVLALVMDDDTHFFSRAIKAGAGGCLLKSASNRELVDAVRVVSHGDIYLGARPARVVSRRPSFITPEITQRLIFERLTHRERGVLSLIAQGFSAREIGERMFISAKTVETYKQRIQLKTGLTHRPEYVQFALALGVLEIGLGHHVRQSD